MSLLLNRFLNKLKAQNNYTSSALFLPICKVNLLFNQYYTWLVWTQNHFIVRDYSTLIFTAVDFDHKASQCNLQNNKELTNLDRSLHFH